MFRRALDMCFSVRTLTASCFCGGYSRSPSSVQKPQVTRVSATRICISTAPTKRSATNTASFGSERES
jgi:hypothetical protein